MKEEEARKILQIWIKCPNAFENKWECSAEESRHCMNGCWNESEVREAVRTLLKTENQERNNINKEVFEMPASIGATIFITDISPMPKPFHVIGYRFGRMMGEDEEEYEYFDDDEAWRIEYSGRGTEGSIAVTEIGKSVFFTREEAKQAAMKMIKENKNA